MDDSHEWQAYTLTYRAESAVLLGRALLGMIQRTRYYAPGWTLWGSITARLTRTLLNGATGAEYESVGAFVRDNLATSYAWVLADGEPSYPHYVAGRLYYGSLPAAEFEERYISSLGKTAVEPATMAAARGSLHETEVISGADLKMGEPTRWRWTLYVRQPWLSQPACLPEDLTVGQVLDALRSLSMGAEQSYGLGRLTREGDPTVADVGTEARPRPVMWQASAPIRAHARLGQDGPEVRGYWELVELRHWLNGNQAKAWGPGQKRLVEALCAPGGEITDKAWQPEIGPYGIWEKAKDGREKTNS